LRKLIWISHEIMLADEPDLDDLVRGIVKIGDSAAELVSMAGRAS
jgi:hypothetical protein